LIPQIAPAELAAWRADDARPAPVLIDVREPWEFDYCRIDGSLSLPLSALPACHHGSRSQHAAQWLARNGFARVHNLRGGVAAWAADVDPEMRRY
jgi:rhodanese-related sulfurtransferase